MCRPPSLPDPPPSSNSTCCPPLPRQPPPPPSSNQIRCYSLLYHLSFILQVAPSFLALSLATRLHPHIPQLTSRPAQALGGPKPSIACAHRQSTPCAHTHQSCRHAHRRGQAPYRTCVQADDAACTLSRRRCTHRRAGPSPISHTHAPSLRAFSQLPHVPWPPTFHHGTYLPHTL